MVGDGKYLSHTEAIGVYDAAAYEVSSVVGELVAKKEEMAMGDENCWLVEVVWWLYVLICAICNGDGETIFE